MDFRVILFFIGVLSSYGESSSCCWCGKRYDALPGYWEGANPESINDRFEVDFLPSSFQEQGSVVVVRPRSEDMVGSRIIVESNDIILLDEVMDFDKMNQFEIFTFDLLAPENNKTNSFISTKILSRNNETLMSKVNDFSFLSPLSQYKRAKLKEEKFSFGWFVNYGGWLSSIPKP